MRIYKRVFEEDNQNTMSDADKKKIHAGIIDELDTGLVLDIDSIDIDKPDWYSSGADAYYLNVDLSDDNEDINSVEINCVLNEDENDWDETYSNETVVYKKTIPIDYKKFMGKSENDMIEAISTDIKSIAEKWLNNVCKVDFKKKYDWREKELQKFKKYLIDKAGKRTGEDIFDTYITYKTNNEDEDNYWKVWENIGKEINDYMKKDPKDIDNHLRELNGWPRRESRVYRR